MDINKFMTPRLYAVSSFIKKGSNVCDVGTDHAYIPIWLVKNNISDFCIAMDINEGPILRADQNIKKFGLESKIKTRLSDGLKELCENECDTVIIAGMGGILINRILQDAKFLQKSIRHYVLQPMTAAEETRRFLEQNGFLITDEKLAKEDNKIYNIISAVHGDMKIENEIDYYVGKKLVENKDVLLKEFLDGKIYELDKAINSMKNTENIEAQKKRLYFDSLCTGMKKIRKECEKW